MIRIQYEIRGGSERNTRPHEVWCISNYSAIPLTLSGGVNQITWSRVTRENSMTSPQAIPVIMNIMTTVNVTRKHAIAWDMGSKEKPCINYAGTLSWNANNYNSKTWKSSHESHGRASIKRKIFVNPVQQHKAGCDRGKRTSFICAWLIHDLYI